MSAITQEAVKNDDADFGKMDEDADLDPIRDEQAFAEIMKAGHPDHRYAAVWSSDAISFDAIPLHGLDQPPLAEVRELIARIPPRVVVSGTQHSRRTAVHCIGLALTYRPGGCQGSACRASARAAIALVCMGKAEEVWALLRHSPIPVFVALS